MALPTGSTIAGPQTQSTDQTPPKKGEEETLGYAPLRPLLAVTITAQSDGQRPTLTFLMLRKWKQEQFGSF